MFHMYRKLSINKDVVYDFSAERAEVCNFTLHKSTWSITYGVHICLSKETKWEQGKDKYVVQNRTKRQRRKEGRVGGEKAQKRNVGGE